MNYKQNFISRAKEKFNNRYDYSDIEYKDGQTPITFACPIHGSVSQKPNVHLLSKFGCPKCGREYSTNIKRLDIIGDVFGRLTAKSLDPESPKGKSYWFCDCICGKETRVELGELRKGRTKSCGCLLEDKGARGYEKFQLKAINRINKETCFTFKEWLTDSGKYEGKHTKTLLVCDKCGEESSQLYATLFKNKHDTCRMCRPISRGFDLSKEGYLYVAEIFNKDIRLLKVGITNRHPENRLNQIIYLTGLSFRLLGYIKDTGSIVSNLEIEILTNNREHLLNTGKLTSGNTETFCIDIKEKILREYAFYIPKVITTYSERSYPPIFQTRKKPHVHKEKPKRDYFSQLGLTKDDIDTIFNMAYIDKLGHKEIAEYLNINRRLVSRILSEYPSLTDKRKEFSETNQNFVGKRITEVGVHTILSKYNDGSTIEDICLSLNKNKAYVVRVLNGSRNSKFYETYYTKNPTHKKYRGI
jgi:predicted transcriptional regulator